MGKDHDPYSNCLLAISQIEDTLVSYPVGSENLVEGAKAFTKERGKGFEW